MMREAPKLIATRQLWPTEDLRVELSPYRAQTYIGLRRWYLHDGEWLPGKGLSVHAYHIPFLRQALARAEAEALAAGLLPEEAYEAIGLPLPPELLEGAA